MLVETRKKAYRRVSSRTSKTSRIRCIRTSNDLEVYPKVFKYLETGEYSEEDIVYHDGLTCGFPSILNLAVNDMDELVRIYVEED